MIIYTNTIKSIQYNYWHFASKITRNAQKFSLLVKLRRAKILIYQSKEYLKEIFNSNLLFKSHNLKNSDC